MFLKLKLMLNHAINYIETGSEMILKIKQKLNYNDYEQEIQLSLTNRATHLEVCQGH